MDKLFEPKHGPRVLPQEFLAYVSHELRTPLNVMLGWAQLMRRASGNEAMFRKGVDIIERSARRQAAFLDQLVENTPRPPTIHGLKRTRSLIAKKVLLLDDDLDTTEVLEWLLIGCGMQVVSTSSVTMALDLVEKFYPDLIVSDLNMPGRDGYAFAKEIRASSDSIIRDVPLIALSAELGHDIGTRAIECGFSVYMKKPVDHDVLLSVISELLYSNKKTTTAANGHRESSSGR